MDIHSFRVDYTQENGLTLVIDHPDGWTRGHLHELSLNMMQRNRIPFLLPLDVAEVDFAVRLRYRIDTRKMLSQLIRGRKLAEQKVYKLLMQIAAALDESAAYLLQPDRYILHEDFIFVDEATDTAALVYIPVKGENRAARAREQFASLAVKLLGAVEDWQSDGWKTLIRSVSRDDLQWSDWKQLLSQLLAEHGVFGENGMFAANANGRIAGSSVSALSSDMEPDFSVLPAMFEPESEAHVKQGQIAGTGRKADQAASNDVKFANGRREDAEADGPDASRLLAAAPLAVDESPASGRQERHTLSSSRTRLISAAVGLSAAALPWRCYLENPGKASLALAAGVTLLAAAMVGLVWSGILKRRSGGTMGLSNPGAVSCDSYEPFEGEQGESAKRYGIGAVLMRELGLEMSGPEGKNREQTEAKPASFHSMDVAEPLSDAPSLQDSEHLPDDGSGEPVLAPSSPVDATEAYYRQLGQYTGWLPRTQDRPDATVLLTSHPDHAAARNTAFLQVLKQGRTETIPIRGDSFVIGRIKDAANYVEDSIGVSRTHLEIIRLEDGYGAKDLGSRNGSLLNGEPMIPYKVYPLMEGDVMQILQTRFTFHRGG
jgi:hypothetical protein